ncbi:hypothetical protein [Micropruina sp.]|uniref:hypothetical protein n=1 Tax=Micropruina sp. TaxID=2737536 RepID=UPI0039E34173
MNRDQPEDARFNELMAREFPGGLVPADDPVRPPTPETAPPSAEPASPKSPVSAPSSIDLPTVDLPTVDLPSDFRSWAAPEEPEEPFTPPPPPPGGRWSAAGIAGTVLVVLPLVLVLFSAFGVRFPMLVSVLAGLGFFLGVFLLLHRLQRRPPVDGDGAVV